MKVRQKDPGKLWQEFKDNEKLSEEQVALFRKYEALITETNKKFNLTAVNNLSEMITRHFRDSLALRNFVDLSKIKSIMDVGSGAGVPGIPLKILFPHLRMVLMEVNKKKQKFLQYVIQELKLKNVEICDMDWRTFLRTTEGDIDLLISRAALPDEELIRMFKPSCGYKNTKLIYWASEMWEPNSLTVPFIQKEEVYQLKKKTRKLVFLGLV